MAEDQRRTSDTSELVEDEQIEQEKSDAFERDKIAARNAGSELNSTEVTDESGDTGSPEEAPEEQVEDSGGTQAANEDEVVAEKKGEAEADTPSAEPAGEKITEEEDATALPPSDLSVEDEDVPTSVEAPEELEHTGRLGFTGEIQGRVVTLEDLKNVRDEDIDEAEVEQLQRMYETTLTNVSEHEIVSGRVVTIGEKDVVIDIGFKSDGIVPRNEFDGDLNPGDSVEVFLERIEDHQGQLVLSKRRADEVRLWERIENAYENDEIIEGEIVRRIKGGMIVSLFGKDAFLPGSQIDVRPVRDFDAYLGKRMEFKIVKLNPSNGNVVVSHKALIEKDLEDQRRKILDKMESGQVLEGTVKNITDFGVFIDLGGVDGLLHITDLSWGRVSHPSEVVDLDQRLNVVVLDYDKERQRISLGLKQLQAHPWENIGEKYAEGMQIEGKVVSITDYGAFVELEKGIEGLVHISEMSWTEHIKHPTQKVSLGQTVPVKILNIDSDSKKISLGMKQLEKNPWEGLAERYPVGTVLRGTVRNITNFGVFVEVEPGIDGLVHISDMSWTKKIRHPGEVVKKGQELDVVVLDIDEANQRVSLGHKQIETNPWNQFSTAYGPGTDVEAKIVRFVENGVIVELPLEVEGFVPGSHLQKGGDNVDEAYEIGQTLELRVIEFDQDDKKIVLSETAKKHAEERAKRDEQRAQKQESRDQERREVSKFTKPASGPTTLGELSGLSALRDQMQTAEKAKAKTKATESKKGSGAGAEKAEPKAKATEAEQPEEPKAETAQTEKPAEPKAEAAKAEQPAEPKSEATKAEQPAEPKAEATKAEKPQEPEAEATKAEQPAEPKAEATKAGKPAEQPAEPKAEATKAEKPKEPEAEATKAEKPKEPKAAKSKDGADESEPSTKGEAEAEEPEAKASDDSSDGDDEAKKK